MGRFHDEIIKEKRRLYPYLRFAASLSQGGWPESDKEELLYGFAEEGTYRFAMKGHVLSFGTFSRAVANHLFGLSIPGFSIELMDPDRDWRNRATTPFDTLVSKWVHILVRVFADAGDIYDGTVAQGMIVNAAFPPANRVSLQAQVAPPEQINAVLPRRTITRDDWPGAPLESVGRPVPILYGVLSNAVKVYEEPEEPEAPDPALICECPEYVPEPYTDERSITGIDNVNAPGIRWCDNFSKAPQGETDPIHDGVPVPSLGPTDVWLDRNYHSVSKMNIDPTGGPDGGPCAVATGSGWDSELTRGMGPQTLGLPSITPEPADIQFPRYGRRHGPTGACGMTIYTEADNWGVLFDVWGRTGAMTDSGGLIGVFPYSIEGSDMADSPYLSISGHVKRPNGAFEKFDQVDPVDGNWARWMTRKCHHALVPGRWQCIEMKWRMSTFVDEFGVNAAYDGFVELRIDGVKVIHLQEIRFIYAPITVPTTDSVQFTYWEGVTYRPGGKISSLYLSDRVYCDQAIPVEPIAPENPCEDVPNVGGGGVAAVPAILVDSTSHTETHLGRIAGIETPEQANTAAPTNVVGYTGTPGSIAGGTTTWYRVTGVKAGKETSWSDVIGCDNAAPHYDRIEWDEPPQGAMDSYRIYQTLTPDLNIHQDMGGVLREETYYVKTVPGSQAPGGRQAHGPATHWVEWGAQGEGTPQKAAGMIATTTYQNTYVVAGHACRAVLGVYAELTDLAPATPNASIGGGFDSMSADLIPITQGGITTFYQESEPRMRKLTEGTDYTVQLVDKPSGAFTVLVVTRRMTNNQNCDPADITVNVEGIEVNGDGTGGLLQDGILQFGHFLLNYVFNDYRSGPWFTDVPSRPGLIDTDSFYEASRYIQEHWGAQGYLGARALLEQQDVRTLIQEALVTYNLQFFYRNAIDNNAAAWAVNVIDTRLMDDADGIDFTPEHMVLDTFQTEISSDYLANVINFVAGPNLGGSSEGEQTGWVANGTLEDGDSVERTWGRREVDVAMPWTRDYETAVNVAGAYLDFRAYPCVVGSFQTMGRGVLVDVGGLIRITHPDGPGDEGWEHCLALVVGHDHDLDSGLITIKFMSTAGMGCSGGGNGNGGGNGGGNGNGNGGGGGGTAPGDPIIMVGGNGTSGPFKFLTLQGTVLSQEGLEIGGGVTAFCRTSEGHVATVGSVGVGLLSVNTLTGLSVYTGGYSDGRCVGADASGYWYVMQNSSTAVQFDILNADAASELTRAIDKPTGYTGETPPLVAMAVTSNGLLAYCWMMHTEVDDKYYLHLWDLDHADWVRQSTDYNLAEPGAGSLACVPGTSDLLVAFTDLNGTGVGALRRYTADGSLVWTAAAPAGAGTLRWGGLAQGQPGSPHFLAWAYDTNATTFSGVRYCWFAYATGEPDNLRNFTPEAGEFRFDSQIVVPGFPSD